MQTRSKTTRYAEQAAEAVPPQQAERRKEDVPRPNDEADFYKALRKPDLDLLLLKQRKLRDPNSQAQKLVESQRHLQAAVSATLIFAGETAGTAVCISASGLLLTCGHCIAETDREFKREGQKPRWLLFASGDVVQAKCVAWDSRRDLALLKVERKAFGDGMLFPYVAMASTPPRVKARLICIGQPGSEDLESEVAGMATGYDVLHVSEGRFRGVATKQDIQDNSEIGALMHDCWTYWGHSGAPLVDQLSGELIGLHSSWDDQTGMRRGIAWDAVRTFLNQYAQIVLDA